MTAVRNEVNTWQWKSLATLAAEGAPILYGILQPGPNTLGGIPYVRPTEIVSDVVDTAVIRRTTREIAAKYKRSVLKSEDIILSIVGTIGKVAIVPPELEGGNITQSSVRIRVRRELAIPSFVAWALRSPVLTRQYDRHRLGTAVPRLNVAHVRELQVPVPPLDEQQRIVAEIEKQFTRLDAGVASLKRVQTALKRYRASVLKSACEGRLVTTEAELARKENRRYESGEELLQRVLKGSHEKWDENGRYKEPVAPNVVQLPNLPEGWVWATWDQLSQWVTYGFTRPMPHVDAGIPIVTAKNIKKGKIDYDTTDLTTPEAYSALSEKDRPQVGDILITKDGTIGRAAVVENSTKFCINQSVAVVWLRGCLINRRFLLAVIESDITQKPIWAKARGVAIKHLSITDFAKLAAPIPPLPEQERIVCELERHLSVIDELNQVVDSTAHRATRLRSSILARAFLNSAELGQNANSEC